MSKPKVTASRAFLTKMVSGQTIKGAAVKVGVFEGQHTKPRREFQVKTSGEATKVTTRPPTNAELALWLHEGVPSNNTPPRPFLSQALNGEEPEVKRVVAKAGKAVVSGKLSLEQAVETLGLFGRNRVQEQIRAKEYAPNSPVTVAAKGSATPLIDTGELAGSISYRFAKPGDNQ